MSRIELRHYQESFIGKIREAIEEGHESIMAVLPTGGGKTVCFSFMSEEAAYGNDWIVLILLHRKQLVKQTSKSLTKNGIPHGIIKSGHKLEDKPIQVCSVQTLVKRLHMLDLKDKKVLIITDEGHHLTSKTYQTIYKELSHALKLAVTATPIRTDGKGFSKHCSALVIGCQVGELIEEGWLSRPILYAPEIPELDLTEVSIVAGDFNKDELALAMDKPTITGSAVEQYKLRCPEYKSGPLQGQKMPAVAFCVSIKHAEHVAAEFTKAGIPAESIDGTMDDEQRDEILERLENGTTKVLTSCDLISEGFDLPAIACAILLRPTHSLALYLQQAGRALRPAPDKEFTVIIDLVQNWVRHDPVEWPRDWASMFDGVKKNKKKKGAKLVTCDNCFCVFPPEPTCPSCGHNMKPTGAGGGAKREVEEKDGNVIQIDTGKLLEMSKTKRQAVAPVVQKLVRLR